jgi:hypothetical protein
VLSGCFCEEAVRGCFKGEEVIVKTGHSVPCVKRSEAATSFDFPELLDFNER